MLHVFTWPGVGDCGWASTAVKDDDSEAVTTPGGWLSTLVGGDDGESTTGVSLYR